MNMLAIDRSTDTQSVAVAKDGKVVGRVFAGLDARSAEWPLKIRAFLADNGLAVNDLDRILVLRVNGVNLIGGNDHRTL